MNPSGSRWWNADRAAQFRLFAQYDGASAPLYGRLSEAIAEDGEVASLLDAAEPAQQRAVLLFAAVHYLLLGDPTPDLAQYYPSLNPGTAAQLQAESDPWPAFRAFCADHREELSGIIATRNTQTNEVGRCAAIVPALEIVHRACGQPLTLLEVGASAGLNLGLDRYRINYSTPDRLTGPTGSAANSCSPGTADLTGFSEHVGATGLPDSARSAGSPDSAPAMTGPAESAAVSNGAGPVDSPVVINCALFDSQVPPLPAGESVPIADRIGLDLHPGDVTDPASVRWLEACIFADRVDRLARLRAAVALARTSPPRIERGDAVAGLSRVASLLAGDGPLVVFHSWTLSYIDDAEGFAAAVGDLAQDRDVWWLSIEPSTAVPGLEVPARDPRYSKEMAANTVTSLMHMTDRGRVDRVLARSHPHLDWVHWLP